MCRIQRINNPEWKPTKLHVSISSPEQLNPGTDFMSRWTIQELPIKKPRRLDRPLVVGSTSLSLYNGRTQDSIKNKKSKFISNLLSQRCHLRWALIMLLYFLVFIFLMLKKRSLLCTLWLRMTSPGQMVALILDIFGLLYMFLVGQNVFSFQASL